MRTGADMAAPENNKEIGKQGTEARLFFVDGSNQLFQTFYGMPARIINTNMMVLRQIKS